MRLGVQFRTHDLVVSPQGHGEAVTLVDPRLNPSLQRRDEARGFTESQSEFDLKRGYLLSRRCYSGETPHGNRCRASLFES